MAAAKFGAVIVRRLRRGFAARFTLRDVDDRIREAIVAVRAMAGEDLADLAAGRRVAVARWRQAALGEPHRPDPWASERAGSDPRWLATEAHDDHDHWVGLDAAGWPVLAEFRRDGFGEPEPPPEALEVWFHEDGCSDVRTLHGARRTLFDEGRATAVVELDTGVLTAERWTWKGGVPVRGDIATVGSDWRSAQAYQATVDDQGRLTLLASGYQQSKRRGDDEQAALDASLAEAATIEPDQAVYDARMHRYEPHLRATDQLAKLLPAALEDAVVAAVAAARVERPFVVDLGPGSFMRFRPYGRIGGERFRERMVALSPNPEAAVDLLCEAKPPDGATFELVEYLNEDAAQACREIQAALNPLAKALPHSEADERERERASRMLGELGRELALRLNRRAWPGAAEPFLVLVDIGEQSADVDPYALAAEAVGAPRVAAFRASLQPARKALTPPLEARHDRSALEALLVERGLPAFAHRLAHQVAQLGLRLHASDRARSRLGGPALLPPGAAWPHAAENRPLTFLAAIDLSELPERGPLPEDGWLLFFADLDNEDGDGLVDEADNELGGAVRVLALPIGDQPVPATQPAVRGDVLRDRPVTFEAQLTLPDGYNAAAELGLDPAEREAYSAVASWLRYGDEGWSYNVADHWVLGAVTGEQGETPEANTVLLLHLTSDEALGFQFLDAGDIQFRIPADALAGGDWTAARALGSSG